MPCWIALHTSIIAEPAGSAMDAAAAQRAVACLALGFTPRVALVDEAVVLDVSGSLRLFGGLARLMQALTQKIDAFFDSNLLAAQTKRAQGATSLIAIGRLRMVGAACADAVHPARLVAGLPMHTLSAARPHLGVLERIGCRNWGDLLALPRDGSARRFGSGLFDALDRARGHTPDHYDWLTLPEQFDEKIELDALVTHAPALMTGAGRLLVQLQAWLLGRQSGLTALRLVWHLDKRRDVAPTGELEIRTANPAQDLRHVARLVSEHLAQQKLPAPVHSLRLQSLETQKLADSAAATGSLLLEAQHFGSSATELIERLSARLGDANVLAWQPQADHRPEQMQRWVRARDTLSVAIKTGAARARIDWAGGLERSKNRTHSPSGRAGRVEALYPSWLLAEPLVLATFGNSPMYQGRLQRLAGPQRLEATGWASSLARESKEPPRSLTACSSLPPEGAARLRPGKAGSAPGAGLEKKPPRSFASHHSLPLEGAAAPAVWQRQSRGPLLVGEPGPQANNQAPAIRDYFIYRSQQGALLWVYSERLQGVQAGQGAALRPARTWYLHGFFA